MNVVVKSNERKREGQYVLVFHNARHIDVPGQATRFLCQELGESDWDARKIGMLTFLDAYIAPDSLAIGPLSRCKFERSGSFENVGRYIGAMMQRAGQRDVKSAFDK